MPFQLLAGSFITCFNALDGANTFLASHATRSVKCYRNITMFTSLTLDVDAVL